jgi:hypothetical protein
VNPWIIFPDPLSHLRVLCVVQADGKPLYPHTVSQAFERAQRRGEVSPIRHHDLRDTHANLLLHDRLPINGLDSTEGM